MKSIGIIAEYNPFHRGHRYQISYLKDHGVKNIAVALSGPFVQRGAPAWTDKFLRTKMALEQGVDFVFELPVLFALSSAEGFALGGVSLLNVLPLDGLCFGSECGHLEPLQHIADFLTEQDVLPTNHNESTEYQNCLQDYLRQGYSYPAARERALCQFSPELFSNNPTLLSDANNILAIEYLKALKRTYSPLRPMTLTRNDAGYHSRTIDNTIASASAIRHTYTTSLSLEECRHALPENVYSLLLRNKQRYPMQTDDFSNLLYLRLRQMKSPKEYTHYGNISPELAQRMGKQLPNYRKISTYIEALKTKNITYSSISRSLFCLLLGITSQQLTQIKEGVPYLRLLGMRQEKSSLLRQITNLPIITKVANYQNILETFYLNTNLQSRLPFALNCFETDLAAADIYRQAMYHTHGYMLPDEYRSSIQSI